MTGSATTSHSSLAIDADRTVLAEVARDWLADKSPIQVVRAMLEPSADTASLPPFWPELHEIGWPSLAVPAEQGGQGAALAELCVVLEEWGAAAAPGPLSATALFNTVLAQWAPELLQGEVEGAQGAVAVGGAGHVVDGAVGAEWLIVAGRRPGNGHPDADDTQVDSTTWLLIHRPGFEMTEISGPDPTRGSAMLDSLDEDAGIRFRAPTGAIEMLSHLLWSAEALGVARWCVETAAEWAREREQFGRPIGQFQAVKHRCADSLCRLEVARAAVWDAARLDPDDPQFSLAASAAAALAPAAAFECAKDAIQVLGGIGYTWEHDAHIYLRRATHLKFLSRPPTHWHERIVSQASVGARREMGIDLPADASDLRDKVARDVAAIASVGKSDRDVRLADEGWLNPHWPEPWGRGAGALEQLLINEELRNAKVRRQHLAVAGWVLPTLIAHGSGEQQQRWIPASLRQEITWCQLFSEPGAGSDLASLTSKAEVVDGGFVLNGQKVWTTMADESDFGLCLARTDPDADKHEGISCLVIDMSSPGVDVRPLRELTGFAMFNEVFFDDVFVPLDCLVGPLHGGWKCARTTLENERVSMAAGSSFGPGVLSLLALAQARGLLEDPMVRSELGSLLVESQALAALGVRTTLRALERDAGGTTAKSGSPESSVAKLVGVEHVQRIQEAALEMLGDEVLTDSDSAKEWFAGFLGNRALSIAGGTSEIQRNVIAERLLGLPRD